MNAFMKQNTPKFQMVCIVAMAKNRVIGDGVDLIWHLPGDLMRVKQLTMGCPLIMGRRTFDSIGQALPGRLSVVMTRDENWRGKGAVPVMNLAAAIDVAKAWLIEQKSGEDRLILFGGGEVYEAGLPYCQTIEATLVDAEPSGGVEFPAFERREWTDKLVQQFAAEGDVPSFSYHRLTRKCAALALN
jgi:dihydrofolate reductase